MAPSETSLFTRRDFVRFCLASGCAIPLLGGGLSLGADEEAEPRAEYGGVFYEKEARFWQAGEDKTVSCELCPRSCTVPQGARGFCGVRMNRGGKYYTLVWGNPCGLGIDPIEKKPFFHVLPGAKAFSIAAAGCNLRCKFCQNWDISQSRPEQTRNVDLPPAAVVAQAVKHDCQAVAFTYSEPVVFFEYMYDTAVAARERKLRPLVVSNGFINADPMAELCKVVTAVKIDLKGYTEGFYRDVCGARLRPVLETLVLLKKLGMWFEIVNLIVPTLNDKPEDIRALCRWVKQELGADVPLHFSAFTPLYKLANLPRTPDKTMFDAYDVARAEGLNYVYVGNIAPAGHRAEKTYCPKCGKVIVDRRGYVVDRVDIKGGKCGFCGWAIPGVWQ